MLQISPKLLKVQKRWRANVMEKGQTYSLGIGASYDRDIQKVIEKD